MNKEVTKNQLKDMKQKIRERGITNDTVWQLINIIEEIIDDVHSHYVE